MKKKIAALLFAITAVFALTVTATDSPQTFVSVTGEVEEFWENESTGEEFIRVRTPWDIGGNEIIYSYTDFSADGNTFFLGKTPEIGDTVTGFFDNNVPMIMIYPPQHIAAALVNRTEGWEAVILARFDENRLSGCGRYILQNLDEAEIVFQGGDAFAGELLGRKLLIEAQQISAVDTVPVPINAQRITVLYERPVPPIGEIDFEPDFDLDSALILDTVLFGDDPIFLTSEDLQTYVPLRVLAEWMGVSPYWDGETQSVTVQSPMGEIRFTIGSEEYYVTTPAGVVTIFRMAPPILTNNITSVPMQFFRGFFGLGTDGLRAAQNYLRG